jgi:hypothetical protein
VSVGTEPKFTAAEKQTLRAFTDTGGTLLLSTGGKGSALREWTGRLAKEVWPEWPLRVLPREHPVNRLSIPLEHYPEAWGLDDHERTFLFCVPEDLSKSWQGREFSQKEYLFKWAINLDSYATDRAPKRSRLAQPPSGDPRYPAPTKPGPRTSLKLARLKHGGDWWVGANYGAFPELAKRLKEKAGIALDVTEPRAAPVTEGGVEAKDLKGFDAAYLTGTGAIGVSASDQDALKAYVAGGGLVWVEAAHGAEAFDKAFRDLAKELGWEVRLIEKTQPLMTGKLGAAVGYDLTQGVQFRLELRKKRLGRNFAELYGLFVGEKMVGVYSPYDILFSTTPYQAGGCLGYKTDDANAVATNVLLWMTR